MILVIISYTEINLDWDLFKTGIQKAPIVFLSMLHVSFKPMPLILEAMLTTFAIAAFRFEMSVS